MPTRNKQKSDSIKSILDFLGQEDNPKPPLKRKKKDDEDDNIFDKYDAPDDLPPTPPNMITGDY